MYMHYENTRRYSNIPHFIYPKHSLTIVIRLNNSSIKSRKTLMSYLVCRMSIPLKNRIVITENEKV
jgi:hypothetical protein